MSSFISLPSKGKYSIAGHRGRRRRPGFRRALGAIGLVFVAAGCIKPASGLNDSTAGLEQQIEVALTEGRVGDARELASGYERRAPGPRSWAYMGRVFWRSGALTAAEGFHRRAWTDGYPEGALGLARARAARGELEEALELATLYVDSGDTSPRGERFLAALHLRLGDTEAAALHLARAAGAADAGSADELVAQAQALAALAAAQPGGHRPPWSGAAGPVRAELDATGNTWLRAEVGGRTARLRFDPWACRSTLRRDLVTTGSVDGRASYGIHSVGLGSLATGPRPWRLVDEPDGDGVLGFDVLVDLRWIWWPASGSVFVGAADNVREERQFQRALPRTHWLAVRTPVDGLAVQLLLMPRLGTMPVPTTLRPGETASITPAGAARALRGAAPELDTRLTLRTRAGAWDAETEFRVTPEIGRCDEIPMAAPAALGADFLRAWGWRWTPASRQLALIEPPADDAARVQ